MIVLEILGIYLALGMVSLIVLDIITHRIRERFADASFETKSKFANTGTYLPDWQAKGLMLLSLWIFWVVAIYGVLTPKRGKNVKK